MRKYVGTMSIVVILLLTTISLPVAAQDPEPMVVEASVAEMPAPVFAEAQELAEPPVPTEEQLARMEWATENTHLSRDIVAEPQVEVAGPAAGTESAEAEVRLRSGQPLAPGDATMYRFKAFGGSIPAGYKSNVMESSLDGKAKRHLYSGNWFAARSLDKGVNWTFIDPYADFPLFCCDQVVLHDTTRDIFLWLRMGVPYTDGTGNYENEFRLSVDFRDPIVGGYWTYITTPMDVSAAWTNQWWDYPHMQLGADYLYIAWNMFNQAGSWTRTVMLRWPLDAIAAGAGFSYNYYAQSDWFTFVPVSGADHAMYFASNWENPPYDRLRVYRWYEDSASLTVWTKTVAAWTPTGRGDAQCGTPNWTARLDQRLLTGARYNIYNDGIAEPRQPGREILAWWWTVQEGGGFTWPYIDAAAFYEDTMGQLPGYLGRPYIFSGSYCFAYPSTFPNLRGDQGMVFNYSSGSAGFHKPGIAYALADDYATAPPGWFFYPIALSLAGPSDLKWGDYNTSRAFQRQHAWIAAAHYIPTATNCTNCSVPIYWAFGRERDLNSWKMW